MVQALLLILRMETVQESKVILIFHIVGTLMELFKTHVGSWTYPEHNFFRIGHVPLFSGFMYASVGSFIARTSRILDLRYSHYPDKRFTVVLAILIYANFLPITSFGIFAFCFLHSWRSRSVRCGFTTGLIESIAGCRFF